MGLKCNVGSGQRRFDTAHGWVNIDCVSRPPDQVPDVIADGAHLPYQDGSVEMVVLHHVLEHYGCGEADGMVKEAWRVLQPGGRLLVFVPDLKALAERWLTGGIGDFIYTVNLYGAYQGLETDRHKWGWSLIGMLRYLNQAAGWRRVVPFDWRPIAGADIAGPDWWIAGAECVK